MNLPEILRLKYPDIDFLKDIILQDDSDNKGPYIKEWNLEESEPTQKDLNQWAIELDLAYRQQKAVSQRQYPPIGDQLDMIYKDMLSGTSIFKDTITAVKAAHPKPTE